MTEIEPSKWRLELQPAGLAVEVVDTGCELVAVAIVWRGALLALLDEPAGEA